jgi:hypothetical protein
MEQSIPKKVKRYTYRSGEGMRATQGEIALCCSHPAGLIPNVQDQSEQSPSAYQDAQMLKYPNVFVP